MAKQRDIYWWNCTAKSSTRVVFISGSDLKNGCVACWPNDSLFWHRPSLLWYLRIGCWIRKCIPHTLAARLVGTPTTPPCVTQKGCCGTQRLQDEMLENDDFEHFPIGFPHRKFSSFQKFKQLIKLFRLSVEKMLQNKGGGILVELIIMLSFILNYAEHISVRASAIETDVSVTSVTRRAIGKIYVPLMKTAARRTANILRTIYEQWSLLEYRYVPDNW